jgi:arylsulfatase A-like enzyme
LTENEDGEVQGYSENFEEMFSNQTGAYTTEFLTDRALNFIDERKNSDQPSALMLSLPDPHGPNFVHAPYNEMFNDLVVDVPLTAEEITNRKDARPKWNTQWTKVMDPGSVPQIKMKSHIRKMKVQQQRQDFYRLIFGMVKAIDDNVGRILHKLDALNINDNTIVIFTSDHGDMMGEWARDENRLPYKTSAGVPFIIRYQKQVMPGKVINSAVSALDFTPTILNMVGIELSDYGFEGIDRSKDLQSREQNVLDENSFAFSADTWAGTWASCITSRYACTLKF